MKKLLLFFLVAFLTSCEMLDDYIAQLESKNYDYTYIDMKDYPDWDCGIITKDDLYMFVKQDSLTNESVAYVNVKDANTDGITLYFNDCSRLSSFITERGQCYLYWNGEETADIHIITEDKNEIIENVAIPYFPYPETRVVWVPIFVNVARGLLVALTVKGAIDLTGDLVTGDFKGVGTDLIEMIAGGKTGKMFTDLITGYGFEGLKWSKGNYDKKLQNCLLGDCQIQVSSNKEGINNYSITVAISGYETLPVLNSITGEKSVVIAGVVVRKSFEHVDYSTNDDTLLTFQVDGNGAKTIHFELPENSVYYVASYLLPTRYGKYPIIGGLRHGNTIRLDCFDGYIDSFKQLSYKKENGKYTFECTAHAICNAGEDHMWMLYYMDDKKMLKTYFEEQVAKIVDTREWVKNELKSLGFVITEEPIIESPHKFGIPQVRDRVYILGVKEAAIKTDALREKGKITRDMLDIDSHYKVCPKNCIPMLLDAVADPKYYVPDELVAVLV